jgi:hypothetical protein
MKSRAIRSFWDGYHVLPKDVQKLARKQYRFWLADHSHPSVQFKKIKRFWSARVTEDFRTLGVIDGDTVIWFWIGSHAEYDKLLKKQKKP